MTQPMARSAWCLVLMLGIPFSRALAQSPVTLLRFQPYPAYLGRGPARMPYITADTDSVRKSPRDTHWQEGAVIGGVTFGVAALFLTSQTCDGEVNCSGHSYAAGLLGALSGAVVGGLVGSFMAKD